jgi:hypothetical protein
MRLSFVLSALGVLALLGVGLVAQASPHLCNASLRADPVRLKSVSFLQSLPGRSSVGTCSIELHVCDAFSDANDQGEIVGDLLVTEANGRQTYVAIAFGENDGRHTIVEVLHNLHMFHYEFDDFHDDPLAGHHQGFRLEIIKDRLSGLATRIELGAMTSHNPNYDWVICDAESKRPQ